MAEQTSNSEIVAALAEEFVERYRNGERPPLEEYKKQHPHLADEIDEVFPALVMIEGLAPEHDASIVGEPTAVDAVTPMVEQLGDFRILREVGRGGMGVVYEAEQVSLGRHVALKVLPQNLLTDAKQVRRFEREAKSAAKLHHTNIVPIFGVGEHDGMHYYVMQFIQGLGLDEVFDELKRIQEDSPKSTPQTGIEIPASRRDDVSALHVARSLLTGGFHQTLIADELEAEDSGNEVQATTTDLKRSRGSGTSGPSIKSTTDTSRTRLSDTFSQSGSISLPGQSASELLTKSKARQLTYWQSVATMGVQVASALQYAHDQGIQHRDIKPSNLMLDLRGTVWVTDFGLAKTDDQQNLTHTGDILGTLRYMPPEAFSGKADQRGDLYSLGLTLYEMLAMQPAFDERDRNKLIRQVTQESPKRLDKIISEIPRDLVTVIHKAIERDPAHRYQSGRELAEDLQRFIEDEPIKARRISLVERFARWSRRNKGLAASLSVVATLVLVAAIGSTIAAGYFQNLNRDLIIAKENADTSAVKAGRSAAEADRERKAAQRAQRAEQKIAEKATADREIAQRDSYRSTIMLAESMLKGDDQSKYRVADLLWETRPELRGWEWGYLMARCPLEQWGLQTRQGGLVRLAASPDGRFLATEGVDGTVALWDSWTRKELWRQKTGRVRDIAIDSQSRYVAITTHEESQPSFSILDRSNGRFLHQSKATGVAYVAFSSSGRDLFVYRWRAHLLERFRSDDWTRLSSVEAGSFGAQKIFADAAGAYVGVHWASNDRRQSSLFDAQSLRPAAELDRIIPDGKRMHIFSNSRPVLHSGLGTIVYSEGPYVIENVLDSRAGRGRIQPLFAHPVDVIHLAFDPRSRTVVAAGSDGTVTRRDSAGKTQTFWHGAPISGMALLSDGRIITAGADGWLKCWEPGAVPSLAANTDASPSPANATVVAFAGKRLLYRTWENNRYYLFELNPLRLRRFLRPGPGGWGTFFPLVRPTTNELVLNTPAGLSFYRLGRTGPVGKRSRFVAVPGPYSAAFDASGRLMAVSTEAGNLAVFDLKSNRRLPVPEPLGRGPVAINPKGTRAAILTRAGLHVWDVPTGRTLQRVDFRSGAELYIYNQPIAFHPDGKLIAYLQKNASNSTSIILWDCALGKRRASVQGAPGIGMGRCVFSQDGGRLFAACSDAKVRIWDWRLGKELLALSDINSAYIAAPSPDGVTIAYAGWAPSLRIAKALPWTISRDADFYRAVDDFRTYSAQFADHRMNARDQVELLGDIHFRRGDAKQAMANYAKAIHIRQLSVLELPNDVELSRRLAALYAKQFAAAEAVNPSSGSEVLQQAVTFWKKLPFDSGSQQYLLDAQLRLVDRRLVQDREKGLELLQTVLQSWGDQVDKKPDDHFVQSGLRQLLVRLLHVSRNRVDQRVIERIVSAHPGLATAIGETYQSAGRTCEAVPFLATASAANPKDTILFIKVAALQAWFGQVKELAGTCARALEYARVKSDPETTQLIAKVCCLHSTQDKTRLASALALARKAVELGKADPLLPWFQLTLGMAEYRNGRFAQADAALLAAATARDNPHVAGTSAFFRAMSLLRQGRKDEARKLAITAAAKMKPFPKDETNPLAGNADHNDLILWLAYKEAKALIKFDAVPKPKAK